MQIESRDQRQENSPANRGSRSQSLDPPSLLVVSRQSRDTRPVITRADEECRNGEINQLS